MINLAVICSGPTIEPIDPVRFISNRSSGRSGMELVKEALARNIPRIIFITGPTCFEVEKPAYTVLPVETALQMREKVLLYRDEADVIIMAAAICDYRVANYSQEKIKKNRETLTLQLVKNPDILFELGQSKRPGQILVGYAAETNDILVNAREKFIRKNLDLLVLNEVSATNPAFYVSKNQVYFFTGSGSRKLETMEKSNLAALVWDEIFQLREKIIT